MGRVNDQVCQGVKCKDVGRVNDQVFQGMKCKDVKMWVG